MLFTIIFLFQFLSFCLLSHIFMHFFSRSLFFINILPVLSHILSHFFSMLWLYSLLCQKCVIFWSFPRVFVCFMVSFGSCLACIGFSCFSFIILTIIALYTNSAKLSCWSIWCMCSLLDLKTTYCFFNVLKTHRSKCSVFYYI